jgi:AraC-like DNA-binding protein
MLFEFVPLPGFDFLTSFAQQFNIPVHGDTLTIPAALGEGRIRKIDLDPDFKLIVHRYKLKEEFILKRKAAPLPSHQLISLIFNSNEEPVSLLANEKQIHFAKNTEYAIQIASTDLDSTIRFTAHTEIYFTVVGIILPQLRALLNIEKPNTVVQTILSGQAGFLYYESMGPDVQKALKELTDANETNPLSTFYYRIKAQELVYLLFEKLLKRDATRHSPINKTDADKLLLVRTAVLSDLSNPPKLEQLARMAGMSETKMSDLFKQVFGHSIYNYFQQARMEEAAFLLKHGGVSVSEAGFRLGFTNMSHFARLFEKHIGLKPKRYASGG